MWSLHPTGEIQTDNPSKCRTGAKSLSSQVSLQLIGNFSQHQSKPLLIDISIIRKSLKYIRPAYVGKLREVNTCKAAHSSITPRSPFRTATNPKPRLLKAMPNTSNQKTKLTPTLKNAFAKKHSAKSKITFYVQENSLPDLPRPHLVQTPRH